MLRTERNLKLSAICLLLMIGSSWQIRSASADSTSKFPAFETPEEFFESRVRPLLVANCYECHTSAESGGLRVDSREALLKGGNSGAAIVPNQPEASLLIQAVTYSHSRLKMPKGKPKLKDEDIASLRQWIKDGAVWAKESITRTPHPASSNHWAYQPIRKAELPKVANPAWSRNEIDRFVLAKLEASYTMEEQRSQHHGNVHIDRGSEIEFF